jgi:acyl-coenzyme A thioesterase PaaI-like protein
VSIESASASATSARRAAAATRRLVETLVNTAAGPDELDMVADELAALAEKLAPTARRSRYEGTTGLSVGGEGNAAVMESHTVTGPANPIAPFMTIDADADADADADGDRNRKRVAATVTYGHQYEGPPGCVHGGMLAAAFDIVLAMGAATCGRLLVTGTITVRYLRPTPLHTELRFDGALVGIEGRKVRSSASVASPDGAICAEAEGTFLMVDDDRYRPA